MSIQRAVASVLVAILSVGTAPALAQTQAGGAITPGTLSGKATDEAKQPYADWAVQLRDVTTGQVVSTRTLNQQGQFSFTSVTLSRSYLVELVQIKEKKIVCTEGPFGLTTANPSKVDVNISCGKVPAAIWLLAAGAGAAAAVAIATRSTSR